MTKKHPILIAECLAGILVLLAITVGLYHVSQTDYIANTPTVTSRFNQKQLPTNSKHLTYVLYYRPGCHDCQHVRPLLRRLARKRPHGSRLYLVNVKRAEMRTDALKKGALATPTVMIYYHGYLRWQYTGTNANKWRKLMTGKAFDGQQLTRVKRTVVQNDFNHTEQTTFLQKDTPCFNK